MKHDELLDTSKLPILSIDENTRYKKMRYVYITCSQTNHISVDMNKTQATRTDSKDKSQILYTFECGCQHVSELLTKETNDTR